MAIANEDGMKSSADQYNDSFAEEVVDKPEPSEDEAFGITPSDEDGAAPTEAADPAPAEAAADVPELVAAPASAASESDQNAVADDEPTDPKEIQRKASWEGRLRKMEADLMARSKAPKEAAAEAIEEAGEKAEAEGNSELGVAAEQVAEQVADGSMTAAQAMKQLAEDFGEDFVKMIEVIASAKAADVGGQATSSLKGEVDEIISHISNSAEKAHFEQIADAHPDFNDVRQDEAFQAFVQAGGADAQRIAQSGSAREIIKLLKDFKASETPAAAEPEAAPAAEPAPIDANQADPEGADAAAGVRSGGLRLPAQPEDNSDYEGAWDEAANSK